jgi:predicted NBD/HSP70 family sugar kinase
MNSDIIKKDNVLYVSADGAAVGSEFSILLRGEVYRGATKGRLMMWLNSARGEEKKDSRCCWMQNDCILHQETKPLSQDNASDMGLRLGVRIAYLINLLRPEAVVIGKVVEEAQTLFFDALHSAIRRWAFSDIANTVKIIPGQLKEDSVALGMAALVCRDAYCRI